MSAFDRFTSGIEGNAVVVERGYRPKDFIHSDRSQAGRDVCIQAEAEVAFSILSFEAKVDTNYSLLKCALKINLIASFGPYERENKR